MKKKLFLCLIGISVVVLLAVCGNMVKNARNDSGEASKDNIKQNEESISDFEDETDENLSQNQDENKNVNDSQDVEIQDVGQVEVEVVVDDSGEEDTTKEDTTKEDTNEDSSGEQTSTENVRPPEESDSSNDDVDEEKYTPGYH